MEKILIEQIINSMLVKYNRLSEMIGYIPTKALNIYIDMYSIVKGLYDRNYNINNYSSLASTVINIVAHYKEFFRKENIEIKAFIVYSNNTPLFNKSHVSGYNYAKEFKFTHNEVISRMIYDNVEIMKLICPYIKDLYFVPGNYETGVIISDLIQRNRCINNKKFGNANETSNLIISKDPYLYQLVPMYPKTIVLRPKKNEGNDLSYMLDRRNVLQGYLSERDGNSKIDITGLNPALLSLIMSLSSVKERNIKMMGNISSVLKSIKQGIIENKIINGYNSNPLIVWNSIDHSKFRFDEQTFCSRFFAVDIVVQTQEYQKSIDCINAKECLVDLKDPVTMKAINAQYFEKNPLHFESL